MIDRRHFLVTTAGAGLAAAAPAFAFTSEDAKLRALLDQMFETQVDESPTLATSLEVLESCVGDGAKFEPVTAGAFLDERLRAIGLKK